MNESGSPKSQQPTEQHQAHSKPWSSYSFEGDSCGTVVSKSLASGDHEIRRSRSAAPSQNTEEIYESVHEISDAVIKLAEQNSKLRDQLRDLSRAVEEAISKERMRRVQARKLVDAPRDDIARKLLLQARQIADLQEKIDAVRRNLDVSLKDNELKDKENAIKALQSDIQREVQEHQALAKICELQERAMLNQMSSKEEVKKKLKEAMEENRVVKEKNRELSENVTSMEKIILTNHESIRDYEEKIQTLFFKLQKQKKEKESWDEENPDEITEDSVRKLAEKIKDMEDLAVYNEREYKDKIKYLESEGDHLMREYQEKVNSYKEKEKDRKMLKIKVKDLKRLLEISNNGSGVRMTDAWEEEKYSKLLRPHQRDLAHYARGRKSVNASRGDYSSILNDASYFAEERSYLEENNSNNVNQSFHVGVREGRSKIQDEGDVMLAKRSKSTNEGRIEEDKMILSKREGGGGGVSYTRQSKSGLEREIANAGEEEKITGAVFSKPTFGLRKNH
eukprot:TRINITY_DN8566_c0_g2_i2.p1 TRINITY_DN8566_c0_g2~~TRINITY_DN8566_c0_g2_i2.p1  ORF type:complete len:507 (+),score=108.07 TRINITY_DN8566_c0_g2_i2:47-1567(+)